MSRRMSTMGQIGGRRREDFRRMGEEMNARKGHSRMEGRFRLLRAGQALRPSFYLVS